MEGEEKSMNSDNVAQLSDRALLDHISRCERVLANSGVVQRLPDMGAEVQRRYALYTFERERRSCSSTKTRQAELASSTTGDDGQCPQNSLNESHAFESGRGGRNIFNTEAQTNVSGIDEAFRAKMMEKYRHSGVAIDVVVRNSFGSMLSELEIQRVLDEIPKNYLLTYDETQKKISQLAREERLRELERLGTLSQKQTIASRSDSVDSSDSDIPEDDSSTD